MSRLGVVLTVALLAGVATAGCFDPFRVHVPEAVLTASGLDWNVTKTTVRGGTFGDKTTETRYVHVPADGSPPFPGVLQVFSLRGSDWNDAGRLQDFTRRVVEEAIEREGISIDGTQDDEGARTLRSGLDTQWFSHAGSIRRSTQDSSFLAAGQQDLDVRILGESAYDGRSKTAFVAVAYIQVGAHTPAPVPGFPATENFDERTWFEVVADPKGTVGGATLAKDHGMIFNLRTHD